VALLWASSTQSLFDHSFEITDLLPGVSWELIGGFIPPREVRHPFRSLRMNFSQGNPMRYPPLTAVIALGSAPVMSDAAIDSVPSMPAFVPAASSRHPREATHGARPQPLPAGRVGSVSERSNVLKSGFVWMILEMLASNTGRPHPFLRQRSREVFLCLAQIPLNCHPESYSKPGKYVAIPHQG